MLEHSALFFVGQVRVKRQNLGGVVSDRLFDSINTLAYLVDTGQKNQYATNIFCGTSDMVDKRSNELERC